MRGLTRRIDISIIEEATFKKINRSVINIRNINEHTVD